MKVYRLAENEATECVLVE